MARAWLLVLVLAVPGVALACPYCAGRGGLPPATEALIGGLLLLPFAIGWTVLQAVRRTSADLDQR